MVAAVLLQQIASVFVKSHEFSMKFVIRIVQTVTKVDRRSCSTGTTVRRYRVGVSSGIEGDQAIGRTMLSTRKTVRAVLILHQFCKRWQPNDRMFGVFHRDSGGTNFGSIEDGSTASGTTGGARNVREDRRRQQTTGVARQLRTGQRELATTACVSFRRGNFGHNIRKNGGEASRFIGKGGGSSRAVKSDVTIGLTCARNSRIVVYGENSRSVGRTATTPASSGTADDSTRKRVLPFCSQSEYCLQLA